MKKNRKLPTRGAMLDLWRPPKDAGDAIGCLATTYTFDPALFDEQCLGRFLDIESEPDREDLAFLLERESRLGTVYSGVLVDTRQAGVEHSLRWDVLRVRVGTGKQHAKLSLLVWQKLVRIIVASANLTEAGYRLNQEVACYIDLTPDDSTAELFNQTITFLRDLVLLVPGSDQNPPEVQRALSFLKQAETLVSPWRVQRPRRAIRQQLVCTLPASPSPSPRSALQETIQACRGRGGSPYSIRLASPFFDVNDESSAVTTTLCKFMARGRRRTVSFCVPAVREKEQSVTPRLAAPKSLLIVPGSYQTAVTIEMLPEGDSSNNRRPWHAKMMALQADEYAALLIGSSNFTRAGMGVGHHLNAEANLLTIIDRRMNGRDAPRLDLVWPETEMVSDPDSAEWLGPQRELEEEEQATNPSIPAGFLYATYRAGDTRKVVLLLDPDYLPDDWEVCSLGAGERELLTASTWRELDNKAEVEIAWESYQPPHRLLVRWDTWEGFLPINVEDSRLLHPPEQLESMTADDMLMILAAADPSAAFRAWANRQQLSSRDDDDLYSINSVELDPLRVHDLQATFLHRIRRRARVLAQLRANLERPVYSRQALDWRLRGFVGIEPLAGRLMREVLNSTTQVEEALLTLSDLLIVLREVRYQPANGSLSSADFDEEYQSFLGSLAGRLRNQLEAKYDCVSNELREFWERVVIACQR